MLALHFHDPDSECHWAIMRGRFQRSKKRKTSRGGGGGHIHSMAIHKEQVNQLNGIENSNREDKCLNNEK